MDDSELKQTKNVFKKLMNDQNSMFYSTDKINRMLLNRSRKSAYEKDKVFYKIYKALENKGIIYQNEKTKIPFYTPFVEQKRTSTASRPFTASTFPCSSFMLTRPTFVFFSKSAVDPKYALLCVDLFSSKICIYPMKKRVT